jgi:NADPH-dependent 2,4-dienoyl-CoA reductase/sulfur reductase-like enzyme/rhodanese-related sulfurtransferase/TusA-related sulfurtransferase
MKRVVIIGGVAGGATAAARLRRLKEDYEIIVLEKGSYVSFANCGLPYYVGNEIKDREQLELMTPEGFKDRYNIDVRINNEAVSIDREKKLVSVRNTTTQKHYDLEYDYLILSPGASPIIPPFEGLEEVPVFTLRTIPDSVKIKKFVKSNNIKHATIIGGGFIGLEMAENLREQGLRVKIVEMLDQVMPSMDKEIAQFIHEELILNGVCLQLKDPVDSFSCDENKDCYYVIPKSGKEIETDMVILSIGVKPESQLAKAAGLEIGKKGHILVDENMKTSDPSIYAVGDAVQIQNFITKEPTSIALAGPANKEGRIAADNIAGRQSTYKGALGSSVVKVFDMTVASVGLSEKQLRGSSITYDKVYVHPNNHAGYYPGATPIALKLLFEKPSGKILGAQAFGGPGTDKRIDVIATVMNFNGTVFDLEDLELTYAPPYGSAKDPVNMAGYVASNVLKGDHPIWHWDELEDIKKNNSFLLDVRTEEEFSIGTIEGATNIPDEELRDRLDEIPKDKDIYVFCEVGYRGYLSTRLLLKKGYNVHNLTGGYKLYRTATASIEELAASCGPPEEIIEEMVKEKKVESDGIIELDACGLSCPGPLNTLIKGLEELPENKRLKVYATDPGFKSSVEAYASLNEDVELVSLGKDSGKMVALLEKRAEKVVEKPVKKKSRKELRGPNAPPITNITPEELYKRLGNGNSPKLIIDVRTPGEFGGYGGHIKGAENFPLNNVMMNPGKLKEKVDPSDEIVVLCAVGSRSAMAAQILARAGFTDIRNLVGGISNWMRKGYPVVRGN